MIVRYGTYMLASSHGFDVTHVTHVTNIATAAETEMVMFMFTFNIAIAIDQRSTYDPDIFP